MTLDACTANERTSLAGVGEDATRAAFDLERDFNEACYDGLHPYHYLARALLGAYAQAAHGKGKERHANALPFQRQRMQTLAQGMGSSQGMTYQVCKKAQECERMEPAAKIRELHGAIVYAAGAIVFEELRDDR